MNFYKNHFGMIISSVVALCLSCIMATCAVFVGGRAFIVTDWVKNWGTAFLTITITGMLIPLTDISFAIGKKLNLKPESTPHVLLENFVATLFFNTTATCVLAAVNVFGNTEIEAAVAAGYLPSVSTAYWESVFHDWPIMFVISFIAAIPVTKIAIAIAKKVFGELKSSHSPQNK